MASTLKLNNVFSSFFVNSFTFFDDLQNMEGAEGNTEICEIIKTGKKNFKKMIINLVQHEMANYF